MGKTEILIEKEYGALPLLVEMEVVDILVANKIPKNHVKFLKPSRVAGKRTPDLLIDGIPWEIKSLDRLGKYTLEHALRAGLQQADNLIIDLRKLSAALENKAIPRLKSEFKRTKSWHGLIVVVRFNGECLLFSK